MTFNLESTQKALSHFTFSFSVFFFFFFFCSYCLQSSVYLHLMARFCQVTYRLPS